jgi:hypothetical protein
MLQNAFPDVSVVDYEIIEQFYNMDPSESPARAIRKRVELLTNVQYGTITRKNCTNWKDVEWDKKHREMDPVYLYY